MRLYFRLLAIAGLVAGSLAAHASVIYDLTLTPDAGSIYGGTGSLQLAGPFVNDVDYYYTNGTTGLEALSFYIDGQTFEVQDATNPTSTFVEFQSNNIWDITFAEATGSGLDQLTLDTSGSYAFYYYNSEGQSEASYGTFSLTPTPEPSSLVLLATGLLGGIGLLSHRRWMQQG